MLLNYLRILTFKRISNLLLCRFSYLLSKCGIIRMLHLPVFVSVEPANRCNLHCPECPVGVGNEFAKAALMHDVDFLEQVSSTLMVVQFYFQGEPLLNKQLPELIKKAHKLKLFTIVSTNAQLLDKQWAQQLIESGTDRIIVSVDGFTQAVYERYRIGGSLEKAKCALQYLHEEKLRQKASTEIIMQCLLLKSNEHEWHLLKQHYKAWGADKIEFKTAQLNDYKNGNNLMPTDARYSRYAIQADGTYKRKKGYHNYCYRLWSGCVITALGDVLPCCFCKDLKYKLGNIKDEPLTKIWLNNYAQNFRHNIINNRCSIKMCRNCTE